MNNHDKRFVGETINAVCREFGVMRQHVLSKNKRLENVVPRMAAMHLIAKYTDLRWEEIGEAFGKDRGTVRHASLTIQQRTQTDPKFMAAMNRIETDLIRKTNGPTDTEMLDWLETQSNGSYWIARQSTNGRGYRLHNTSIPGSKTARDAIAKAMR